MKRLEMKLLMVGGVCLFAGNVVAEQGDDGVVRGERRPASIPMKHRDRGSKGDGKPVENSIRTFDGTGNNLKNLDWGAAETAFLRLVPSAYADGISEPNDVLKPSARAVSNAVSAQSEEIPNKRGATDFLWQWGQFLDHDITETPTADPSEAYDIVVSKGDVFFDPNSTGTETIALNRSFYEAGSSPREQVNAITAFIDASQVYGSDAERAEALRAMDGTGRLKVTASDDGDLLPFNVDGLSNAPSSASDYFVAGDVRANEQVGLTAMHTLFVREHNYWAGKFAQRNKKASGDEIYQAARRIVGAEMQIVTYQEFLPIVLGSKGIKKYKGYDDSVNPGISNAFSTAAYRFGHTLLSPELKRLDENGDEAAAGNLALSAAFFVPSEITDNGIESLLRGMASQRCQELDGKVVDALRNFLFGVPGAGGFDLASLNLQRGRDHGLPNYNAVRATLGLKVAKRFGDISKVRDVAAKLEEVYGSVDQVDLWIGGLCEEHARGAMVGETFHRIIVDQFTRLRDGDRFWYERVLDGPMKRVLEKQTLADIIRRNTEIDGEISQNVFLLQAEPRRGGGGPDGRPPHGGRGGRR